jgi:hypothetical protein
MNERERKKVFWYEKNKKITLLVLHAILFHPVCDSRNNVNQHLYVT